MSSADRTVAGVPYLAGPAGDYLSELERRARGEVRHVPTGLTDLDAQCQGMLWPGNLVVAAGRPGAGKTTLLQQIIEHAAAAGVVTLIITLEMSHPELLERAISRRSGIPVARLRLARNLAQEDYTAIIDALREIQPLPVLVSTARTLKEIVARTRAVVAELRQAGSSLGLVALDYIQLVDGRGGGTGDRVQEVSLVTRTLKLLAGEIAAPVIAISQLNRSLEQRPNKRPILSDLRESGSIEQDADVVLFIYRDEVYNEDSQDKGTAELIIAKNRHGETGTTRVAFLPDRLMFADLDYRDQATAPPDRRRVGHGCPF